jgi:hypothetical protein
MVRVDVLFFFVQFGASESDFAILCRSLSLSRDASESELLC